MKDAIPLTSSKMAILLYDSQELEAAHNAAAEKRDTEPLRIEDHVGNHYICFVKADDDHLWELNGGMKGPVDRGALRDRKDALNDRALELDVRRFLAYIGTTDKFYIVAMAPPSTYDKRGRSTS